MKICAVICEYNPIHDGHIYHMKEAARLTGCTRLVCIMSGNFTQRGIPAMADKYLRAEAAVRAGADMVVELPAPFALGSAEVFAVGGVGIANSFGADYLCFGSETDGIEILDTLAKVSLCEPPHLTKELSRLLDEGRSYTSAYRDALINASGLPVDKAAEALGSNGVLAIEYIKALKRSGSKALPVAVKRKGGAYLSESIACEYPSASALRKYTESGAIGTAKSSQQNPFTAALIDEYILNTPSPQTLYSLIRYKCRTEPLESLRGIYGVNEGIEFALKKNSGVFTAMKPFVDSLVSKRYTASKISRILMCLLLGITKERMESFLKSKPYANVLCVSKAGEDLLRSLPPNAVADTSSLKKLEGTYGEMIETDILASEIYAIICGKENQPFVRRLKKI